MTRAVLRWPAGNRQLRRGRDELAQIVPRELNDLGISRSDIPALLQDPAAWRRDRC
jgi:uncharacterized protein YjiS (DUF1127 family)